jgi:hypothetical protein
VAQRGVEVQFYSSKTLALESGEGSASRPGRTLPQGKTRYPLYRRLGGPQGRSGQVRKISSHTGIQSPDRLGRSQSLYRLSYPGPQLGEEPCVNNINNFPKMMVSHFR